MPKCDKMVMKHEQEINIPVNSALAYKNLNGIYQCAKCAQCKTYNSRKNVPDVIFLTDFIIFNMTPIQRAEHIKNKTVKL